MEALLAIVGLFVLVAFPIAVLSFLSGINHSLDRLADRVQSLSFDVASLKRHAESAESGSPAGGAGERSEPEGVVHAEKKSHAENAEAKSHSGFESHAESAENAEAKSHAKFESHAESAESAENVENAENAKRGSDLNLR